MTEIWTVDIETKPHEAWVWGLWRENIPLERLLSPGGVLMFAAKRYGDKPIEAHCEWDGYDQMITRSHEIYDSADYVVSYNGVGFDTKHLKAAWALAGLPPPSPWREIDLLKTVRRFQLPSRKLAYVTKAFGLDCKADPGGMDTWRQILRPESQEGQLRAQKRMVKYCRQDVKITEQLFERLLPWIDGMNLPLYSEDDYEVRCTRCNSTDVQSRGWAYTTTYRYRRYQCQGCGGWMRDKRSEPTPNAELRNA